MSLDKSPHKYIFSQTAYVMCKKARQNFAARYLIFRLQQENLKSKEICVSHSSHKTNLETNFLNLEN